MIGVFFDGTLDESEDSASNSVIQDLWYYLDSDSIKTAKPFK